MAPVNNRFAKYIIQPDTAGGGSAPAPKANRFAKYKAGEAPAVQQANPMVAQGQAAQQAWRDGGAKPANPNPENPIITAQRGSQTASMGQWVADRHAEANALQDEIDRRKDAYRQKYGPDVKFAGPGFTADPNDRAEEALSVRSIISAANTVPGTVNAILEGSDTMFGSGRHFDQMTGEELQFSNSPKPQQADPVRVTFGDRGAGNGTGLPPPAVEPTRYLPQLNLSPATSVAEMGADMTGELGAYVVMPGKVIDLGFKAAGAAVRGLGPVGRAVTAITPQGAGVVDKSLRYGGRMVSTVPENAAHAFAFGAMAGEDGSRMETGAQFAADPLNYLAQPVASLIQRAGVALKTMGARVTPKAVQLQQAMQTLQRGNATPEQVRQAVATINKITPPRPAETAPLAGAADEAPGAQNAPAPVQGRSDAAIGAAKQQAETRAQLQAALDAANARGDREAAAQLESQLRDSTFIIDPQTGQRAGAATRAAQPQPIPTATQTAAGAPPIQPPPPAVASANAAVPTPGVVPPAGNLVPIPQNEAVAAFNALPPKTREAMLRTLNSAGMDANGFWSDTWRKLTGRFRNSSEAMDAIRKLGDMPEDQQVMFALQLIKNNGGDLETILPAMGRKWATEGARDPQLFGGTDRAREIMDANVPKVINSQGERVAGIAEDKFGPGIVPAGEAIDVEKRVLAKQYDTLLNPQRKQYGRLRNPQKLASIDKAWNDIKAYLKRPEVIDQMPDWVKLKVMQRASEDMRNIGFTDAEMSTILAGDGAVLAPLFEASGPLTWSPQMWTHLVDQYPTQAAHVLQSAYREAADGLMSGVSRTQADVTNAQYLMRLRGESGKGGLVDMLERAIPGKGGKIDGEGGYQWTRTNFGDNRSAERAFDILERFKTAANSEGDVAAIIKELKDLPARHREAAENQITSLIRQELGRKVDNVKLSELDNPDRLSAPNLTALSNQNFLNALEDVFGPRGKELADGIRLARASTDTLTSISPKYNSRTQLNAEDVKNAGARYEDPAGAEGGVIDKTVGGLASGGLATGGAAALGISAAGGLTVPLLGLAAGKALYNAYKAGKRLSNTERNQLVDFLFRARKAGEGDPLPRKINHGNVLRSAAVNAAVGGTIGGLSSEGDPNAIAAGIVGGAGFGAARKIIRSRSSLIKPPGPVGPRLGPRGPATPVNALRGPGGSTPPSSPTNALATPSRPPVKAGFGSSKPLDMSEAGRMQRAREEWGKGYQVFEGTHATSADFDAFDPTKIGQSDPGWYGRGHYFARADKGFKEQYSRPNSKGFAYGQVDQASSPLDRSLKEGSRNIPVLIRMKKPFTDDAAANPKVAQAFWDAGYRSIERDARNGKPRRVLPPGSDERRPLLAQDAETFSNVAKSLGYDGANWGGEIVVFPGNEANIRSKFAQFDPSQSGSSKLLAGMGASPEAVGGIGGGVAGYFGNPTDANQDGVIDDKDRGLNAMGGLVSGVVGGNIAKRGANAIRGAFKPQSELMAAKGSYGARPSAMGDMAGHQAAQKQLKELETYRKTAPASERAAVDQEIADLRGFLEGNSPPVQAGFGGPPKPQANALKPVEARREAPRGNKPFNNPSLSQGENKISEMLLNGYEYPAIADEMMTSVDVVKQLAKRAQDKLGDAVKLPRPGMGKRPAGSTKREAAFGLFDEGLDNATIAERTGLSLGNVRTYRSYWKQESGAPVANVNGASYNPPELPPRPFEADYPPGDLFDVPPANAQGRLVLDMDGRPLNQSAVVVGRSKAPGFGAGSEADQGLRDKAANIQTLKSSGSDFRRTPREELPDQTDGYWNPSYADNGRFTGRGSAVIADDLDRPVMGLDDQELMTIAHELAHNIDFKTNPARSVNDYNARKWGIDPADSPGKAKVNDQLLRIYRDLNNAPGAEAKIGRPLDRGYQQTEEARELWAEAIRAYMWDPNYIKTVAPDVAFLIRHHVNRNSSLRKTIQFNAVPTIAAMGGLGLGAAALNGQPAEAQTRPGGLRANALASQYGERPGR